mmetsp:Transcript_16741/g.29309  ORF Transcript_16741/g.29309 Transcript_16741/m.29309 type:complete len:752 (-) Transcript_16741:65-2320(-)
MADVVPDVVPGCASDLYQLEACKKRLMREWDMRKVLPLCANFTLIMATLLVGLIIERPTSHMFRIETNINYHFKFDTVKDINSFDGVYEFMYGFLDAAERFDPLSPQYVSRLYDDGGNLSDTFSTSSDILITQEKRFTATSAIVLRPQIWMTRNQQEACSGFAEQYDHLYAMHRYNRFKYKGSTFEGGWMPQKVRFRNASDVPPDELHSSSAMKNVWNSALLVCKDHGKLNESLRSSLSTHFHNVKVERDGTTYFGDFFVDKIDILAYLGYKVYEDDVNITTHPNCFTVDKHDEEGQPRVAVTLNDVADRCEHTAVRWHDALTDTIRAQLFMYTPGKEVFTRVLVEWEMTEAGLFNPKIEVESFLDIRNTQQYELWYAMTIFQLLLCSIHCFWIVIRARAELEEQRKYPSLSKFTKTEKAQVALGICLQAAFIAFLIWRLVIATTGRNINDLVAEALSINPYLDEGSAREAMTRQLLLIDFAKSYRSVRFFAFALVVLSFGQLLVYMTVHPSLGLIVETVWVALEDLFNFLCVFGVLYVILCAVGHWAFGHSVEQFSTFAQTVKIGWSYSLGAFDFMAEAERLPNATDKLLLCVWELVFLTVVFLLLLNFFLAIIVDSYAVVKDELRQLSAHSAVVDIFRFMHSHIHFRCRGWPQRPAILECLSRLPEKAAFRPEDLCQDGLFTLDQAMEFARFYCSPADGLADTETGKAAAHEQSAEMLALLQKVEQLLEAATCPTSSGRPTTSPGRQTI